MGNNSKPKKVLWDRIKIRTPFRKPQFNKKGEYIGDNPVLSSLERAKIEKDWVAIVGTFGVAIIMVLIMYAFFMKFIPWYLG